MTRVSVKVSYSLTNINKCNSYTHTKTVLPRRKSWEDGIIMNMESKKSSLCV